MDETNFIEARTTASTSPSLPLPWEKGEKLPLTFFPSSTSGSEELSLTRTVLRRLDRVSSFLNAAASSPRVLLRNWQAFDVKPRDKNGNPKKGRTDI